MKRFVNILISSIVLTLMLFSVAGLSVEKCSCTGRVMLTMHVDKDCCPGENGCMTVKSMQLSDYLPTATASLDMPVQPVLFPVFPPTVPTVYGDYGDHGYCGSALAPPGGTAQTVAVLRV